MLKKEINEGVKIRKEKTGEIFTQIEFRNEQDMNSV